MLIWQKVDQSSVGTNWGVGDIMYADLDGDGKISNGTNKLGDTGDYRIIGNSTPRFKYGITLDAAWKGFDFSIFMQGDRENVTYGWTDVISGEPTDKE